MLINQQIDRRTVSNPLAELPSISTDDLISLMRIDKTFGTDRIASYISDAYDIINGQLPICQLLTLPAVPTGTCVWETAPGLHSHHHRLAQPTPPSADIQSIIGQTVWQRTYRRAVLYEAAALFADNYMDFDTIGQGVTRGTNQHIKSDSLRRIVSHCIADLTGGRRNRVKLL